MQRQEQSDCEHKDPKDDSIPMPPFRENDYGLNLAERASDDVTITKLRENDVLLGRGMQTCLYAEACLHCDNNGVSRNNPSSSKSISLQPSDSVRVAAQ